MNVNDYLIAQPGIEWGRLLGHWTPPLPPQFSLWLVNRLGEAFVVTPDEIVLRLNVGAGLVEEVARSREHFASLLGAAANADAWLRIRLVDSCRRAGMNLRPGECYGFKIPPTLGGQYEVANLKPTALATHYSYQAYICKQTEIYWIPPA